MRKLAVCLLLFGIFLSTPAAADERFTVEIKVDVTDVNASVAREKALNSANRAAISAVARRISTQSGADKIAAMTDAQLVNFVKETSVLNEKNSDVRYMADLKITVNEELLKQYMQEREIPLMLKKHKSVLVVPVFREFSGDTPLLWEVGNPWKQAWENAADNSAIRFIPIQNSAGNAEIIDAARAAAADTSAMMRLQQTSGVDDVYILDAAYNGVEGLIIDITSLSGQRQTISVSGPKSSGAELFAKAVDEVRRQLEQQIFLAESEQPAVESEITILYPFASLGSWINTERLIKGLDAVSDMQVQAMAQGKTQFKLRYTGSLEALQRQLQNSGYRLENGGNYMILQNIGE